MSEEWRDIPNYEGYYQVSDLGRVRSLERLVSARSGGVRIQRGKLLKQQSHIKDKYLMVGLCKDGKRTTKKVHRLVLLSFIGESDLTVNHIDRDRTNNKLENLEYLSHKENVRHSSKVGNYSRYGTRNSRSKLTLDQVNSIRERHKESCLKLAKEFNVSPVTIRKVINRECYA